MEWPFYRKFEINQLKQKTASKFVNGEIFSEAKGVENTHGEFIAIEWTQKKLKIYRDYVGAHPCYYHIHGQEIHISSSLELIAKKLNIKLTVNDDYLKCIEEFDFSKLEETQFNEIKRVPPGQVLEWSGEDVLVSKYSKVLDSADERLKAHFDPQMITSDRILVTPNTGLLLSGGLDSSFLHFLAQEKPNLKSYTMLFDEGLAYENTEALDIARQSNKHFTINYKELGDSPLKPLDEVSSAFIFYSPSLMLYWPLLKLAKQQGSEVLWTGLGGDDVFSASVSTMEQLSFSKLIKLFFTSLKHKPNANFEPHEVIKSFVKKLMRISKGLSHRQVLKKRFEDSGGYCFGMETEQELAQKLGLRMSYPLLDTRLLSYTSLFTAEELVAEGRLTKPLLRELAKKYIPQSMQGLVTQQDYYDIATKHIKALGYKGRLDALTKHYRNSVERVCNKNLTN